MNHPTAAQTATVNVFTRAINRALSPLLALASASAIVLIALLLPAPAMAQATGFCTPVGTETLQADSYRHQPGETVNVTGSGYQPSCTLRVIVVSPDASATSTVVATDANGNLSHSFALNSLAGKWEVGTFMGEDTDPWTGTAITNGAYIETDMPDYAPGNRVIITGAGWLPGESVTIAVDEMVSEDGGTTFTFIPRASLTADVDSKGALSTGDFVTDLLDYGLVFRAGATGQSSGFSAKALFTDGFTATSRVTGNWNVDATWSITRLGKISWVNGSKIITGDGSAGQDFTVDLAVGNVITQSNDNAIGAVASIQDSTHLTLASNVTLSTQNLQTYKARRVPLATDDAVIGAANTVTVTAPASVGTLDASAGGVGGSNVIIDAGQSLSVTGLATVAGQGTTDKITVNGTLNAGSLAITGGGNGSSIGRVDVNTGGAVVVTGALTVNQNSGSALLDMSSGSGTASAGSLAMTASSPSGSPQSTVNIGTGSLTVAGSFTTSPCAVAFGTSNCRFTFSGAGIAHIGGDLGGGAFLTSFNTGSGSTIDFNGSGASSIAPYNLATPNAYQNLTVSKTGGGVATLAGSTTVNGPLTVNSGTLAGGGTLTLTLGGGVANAGTIAFDGGTAGCPTTDLLLLRSTVSGNQRTWSGAGTFDIKDVNIKDQAATNPITIYSSTNGGNNTNWTFNSGCPATTGTIVIKKTAVGGNDTFAYTGTGTGITSGFNITTASGTGTQTFSGLATGAGGGSRSVTESAPPSGWTFTLLNCTSSLGTSTFSTSGQTATVSNLAAGDTVTCEFTNTKGATLTVIKHVINDNGGTKTAADFTMTVTGTNVQPAAVFPGAESPGTTVTLSPGAYSVDETNDPAYTKSFSTNCGGTIAAGESKTCTVTNDDKPGSLTVIKHVINDNSGAKTAADFSMTVTGTNVQPAATFPGAESPGTTVTLNAGSYSVDEAADSGYTKTIGAGCSGTIANGESKTCTITNDDVASATLKVVKHVVNDNGGTATANQWTLAVSSSNGGTGTGSAPGAETPGTTYTLQTGKQYSVAESGGPTGYTQTSASSDCTIASAVAGTTYTCTITNDDVAPTLKVIKHVINDNGGSAVAGNWTLAVSSSNGGSGTGSAPGVESPGTTYTLQAGKQYSVAESGGPSGYTESNAGDCAIASATVGATYTCTITNDDQPGTLNVIKHVINDNGGAKTAAQFSLTVTGTNVQPSATFPGAESPGTTVTLNAGSYSVDEAADSGYTKTIGANCSGTIANGETKTCTITNDDKVPHLTLNNVVINDNGGTQPESAWTLTANGGPAGTLSGPGAAGSQDVVSGSTFQAGTYVLSATGPGGYAASAWTCNGGTQNGNQITLAVGENARCTITNDDIAPKLYVIKTMINDNGGAAAAGDFTIGVTGNNPIPASFAGVGGSGQLVVMNAGSYSVSETGGPFGYAVSYDAGCSGTLVVGQTATCTVTNNDIQPTITVNKVVVPASDPGRFNLQVAGTTYAWNVGNGGTTGSMGVSAPTTNVSEAGGTVPPTVMANYTTTIDCGAGTTAIPPGGALVSTPIGTNTVCTITDTIKDADGDGIPDFLDCTPNLFDNRVVDPAGLLSAYLPADRRHATLQAAVSAAADNDVISMYANTTENVVIGSSTGSGGKDLRIVGCGHKVTAAVATSPVVTVQVSAGANDGNNPAGFEKDINIENVDVLKGSIGFLVQTSKGTGGNNTSTLLKSIRSDQNGPSNGTGTATVANPGHGISIVGDGNEVRGANSIGTNAGDGLSVTGNLNVLESNRITSNKGDGIDVAGNSNTIEANKVGDKSLGNKGNGIKVAGASNTLNENDVFANTLLGITVTGNMNLVYKNDVGEDGKGNLGGGILITGDSNLLGKAASENNVFENTGVGIAIVGNNNMLSKNDVGDKDKGNTGDGINVKGYGNVIDQNNVFGNGGDGIEVSGGTAAKPNVISSNNVGDKGKGNLGNGIFVGSAADVGNGAVDPIEINANTVRANKLNGILVQTAAHQIANNVSGGTGSYASGGQDNGKCEFLVTVAGNFNSGGNTANGAAVTVAAAWPVGTATTCQGTP